MKKILLLTVALSSVMLLPAQGIYQLWGTTPQGGMDNIGVIFKTDGAGRNFSVEHELTLSEGTTFKGKLSAFEGKLYGMTVRGGANNRGVIFQFDPLSKVYTKMFDFAGPNGSTPLGGLTLLGNKFYGLTSEGGTQNMGVIFEWDPISNVYTRRVNFNGVNGRDPVADLTVKDFKLYGLTRIGGAYNSGVAFQWDPNTNILTKLYDLNAVSGYLPGGSLALFNQGLYGVTYSGGSNLVGTIFALSPGFTKKIDLDPVSGGEAECTLASLNGKLYGLTISGGANNGGVIFEWDPVSNVYTKQYDIDGNGVLRWPRGSLVASGGKLYGIVSHVNRPKGVLFEWDPAMHTYTETVGFDGFTGTNASHNDLTLFKLPVANGTPGACRTFPPITINSTNNNQWVPIIDEENNAVAEIKANGNNLGIVTASVFINNGAVREDGMGRLYLDRSITITPQFAQKSPIDIRLYIKGTEFTALKSAHNSFGQTAGIKSINDVGIFKIKGGCVPAAATISNLLNTSGAAWENDYVLSASINSFTSFYFASKNPCAAPVITDVSASTTSLSPADHQMKNVTINYSAKGNCFPITTWLTVTSNEPVSGTGSGDLSPDWIIIDNHHLQLRSERSVSGTGRTYTITVNAKNAFGTYCKKTIKVVVTSLPVTLAKTADGNNENMLFDCRVMPNPSNNYFNVQIESASDETIQLSLLDISGRLITKWNTVKDKTIRFGEHLKPGIYVVKIQQGGQLQTIKLIKQ